MSDPAPIHRDASRLAAWVLDRLAASPDPGALRACQRALDLLDHLTLALAGRDADRALDAADRTLVLLRAQLRLLREREQLTDAQLLHAAGLADQVGRQLGGWRRSREPV